MDLAQALNRPLPLSIGGETFPVRQLTLDEWADLQAWLKAARPSPIAEAVAAVSELHRAGRPPDPAAVDLLYERAERRAAAWPPRVLSAEWYRALVEIEGGQARFLRTVLAAAGVPIDDARAEAVLQRATQDEVYSLTWALAYGEYPDPKADAAAAPAAGPTAAPTTGAPSSTT